MYETDDFLFVGMLPAMKRFFEAQVRLAPFHSGTHSIHGDLVRKHLSWTVGPALGWPAWRCFPALPFTLPETARPRIHPGTIGPWVDTVLDFIVPMPREVWLQMTWRGSPPFAQWADWSGLDTDFRLYFDHREELARRREDFFLRALAQAVRYPGHGLRATPPRLRPGGAHRNAARAGQPAHRFRSPGQTLAQSAAVSNR